MKAVPMRLFPAVRWEKIYRNWGCECGGSRPVLPVVSTAGALTLMPWNGRTAMRTLCRFHSALIRPGCTIRFPATSPIPTRKPTASFGKIFTVRRCSPDRSRASAPATARLSKPKLSALPTNRGISFLWSRWGWKPRSIICRACRPLCRKMSSWHF